MVGWWCGSGWLRRIGDTAYWPSTGKHLQTNWARFIYKRRIRKQWPHSFWNASIQMCRKTMLWVSLHNKQPTTITSLPMNDLDKSGEVVAISMGVHILCKLFFYSGNLQNWARPCCAGGHNDPGCKGHEHERLRSAGKPLFKNDRKAVQGWFPVFDRHCPFLLMLRNAR